MTHTSTLNSLRIDQVGSQLMLDLYLQTYTTVYPMGLTRIRSLTHNWQKSFSFGISLNLLFGSASVSTGALCNLGELHCQLTNIKRILRTGTRIQGNFYQIKLMSPFCEFRPSFFGVWEFGVRNILRFELFTCGKLKTWTTKDPQISQPKSNDSILYHFLAMRKECETSADKTSALSIMH